MSPRRCLAAGIAALALTTTALATMAGAHEFMIVPGDDGTVDLIMTEAYIVPDRVPPMAATQLELIADGRRTVLDLSAGTDRLTARPGEIPGPAVLAASMIRDRMEAPRVAPGMPAAAPRMTRSAAYSKSWPAGDAGDALWSEPVGSRLEIMPLTNPAALKAGDELPVRVLFDGRPVPAMVQATYDDDGREGHGFVIRTTADAEGLARVVLDRPGLWVVRTKHGVDEHRDGYVRFNGGANLVFAVAP